MSKQGRGKIADVVSDLERDLESAQAKVLDQAGQISDYQKELERERKKARNLQTEIDRNKADPIHDQLKKAKAELKAEKSANAPKKLRQRIQILEEAKSALESQVAKLTKEQDLEALKKELREVRDSLNGSSQFVKDVQDEVKEAQATITDLNEQLETKEQQLDKADRSLEETKMHLRESVEKNKKAKKKVEEPVEQE